MKKSVQVILLLFHFLSFSQNFQKVELIEVDYSTKSFGLNLVLYTKEYRVLSEDYTESKDISLKVFKYINKPVSQSVQIPDFYNIQWGQSDFHFLFSAMDKNNPNRKLKVFQFNDIITSFRNKREFVIKEVDEGNFIPVSLLIEKLYIEYQYEVVEKKPKSKEQIIKELDAKSQQIELDSRIEAMVTKVHSLRDYSISEYNSFVYSYSRRVAYDLKWNAKNQLKIFKDSVNKIRNRKVKSYKFKPMTIFKDSSSVKFIRQSNDRYTGSYSPIINSSGDNMTILLQQEMFDIPRACYKVGGSNKCYFVTTEIVIDDFQTKLKRGITIVRTKSTNNELKFYEDLDKEIKQKISEKLKGYRQGKYLVSYQIGYVNSYKISEIVFEKI